MLIRSGCLLLVLAVVPLIAVEAGSPSATPASAGLTTATVLSYRPPVPVPYRVVRPFQAPTSRYGAGHRGVDLATHPGQTVTAAAPGTVTFAGRLAERGVVVIAHSDGVRTEYEPVRAAVRRGEVVAAGQPLGVVDGVHGSCRPGRCLHWGARRGRAYFDPLTLLGSPGPVRLLPWSAAD